MTDLHRANKLCTPADVCEVIHGDDSPAQKKVRSAIIKILCDKFKIAKAKCIRNHYTEYRKWKSGDGPPVAEHFGRRRSPIMPVRLFKEKVKAKLLEKEHQQKDLRKITRDVLKTHLHSKHIGDGLSPIIKVKVSHVTVDKYTNIASTCNNVHHVAKKRHSTKARDTAIRSFRAVCAFIAVVLASQSYPDPDVYHDPSINPCPAELIRKKKDKDLRDVDSVFPYPVKWVNPSLIINTDETTLVLAKNKKGPPKWMVVSKRFRDSKRKKFSQYTTEPDPKQVTPH